MRTSAAALAPSPVSQPFESRWSWSWCCVSSAYGTNSFLGALVVSRVLGRQDRFSRCVAVPCWSRSRHGVQERWPAADTRAQSPHRDDTPTHTRHTVTQADQLTPHTPDHGGIGAVARDRRVAERERQRARGGASQASSTETLPWFQHTIRGGFRRVPLNPDTITALVRLCLRAATRPGASRASTRAVKTSWATRRVKHAHHKTSRRRRRSGEDLGHPADERCGGLA